MVAYAVVDRSRQTVLGFLVAFLFSRKRLGRFPSGSSLRVPTPTPTHLSTEPTSGWEAQNPKARRFSAQPKELLSERADPNTPDNESRWPLQQAAFAGEAKKREENRTFGSARFPFPGKFRGVVRYGDFRVKTVLGSHFGGLGEFTAHFRTVFGGDWDAHWGYGVLTHGDIFLRGKRGYCVSL